MNKSILILLLFFISCQEKSNSSRPLEFLARRDYSHTTRLIIGSDTQAVDKAYEEYYNLTITSEPTLSGYQTFMDSVNIEFLLRKYYISKELEKSINNYMIEYCNKSVDCDDPGFEYYFYEFTHINEHGKSLRCCLKSMEKAKTYYNKLKEIIEQSNNDSIQNKIILSDLHRLIYGSTFSFSVKQGTMILNTAKTPKEKENIQKLIDDLK